MRILDFLVRCVDGGEDEVRGILVVDERVLLRTVADLEGRGRLFVAVGCQRVRARKKKKYPLNEALLITIAGGEISHPSLRTRCHFYIYICIICFFPSLIFFFSSFIFFSGRREERREGEDCRVLLTVFVWVMEKSSLDGLIDGNPTTNLQQPRDFFLYTYKKKKEKKEKRNRLLVPTEPQIVNKPAAYTPPPWCYRRARTRSASAERS